MTALSTMPGLEFRTVRKSFGAVKALTGVTFAVAEGESHGLVGENGAGKSTLMKVLGGGIAPERGTIVIDGETYDSLTPAEATDLGIAFVHQELNLFDNLDVAANVYIGREPHRYGPLRLIER